MTAATPQTTITITIAEAAGIVRATLGLADCPPQERRRAYECLDGIIRAISAPPQPVNEQEPADASEADIAG